MIRRLLLALLLLALSAPAVAMAGHCAAPAQPTVMHTEGHGSKSHHSAPAQAERGDCIGCVLPDLGILTAPRTMSPAILVGTARERFAVALAQRRPDTPPPRS
jgi:hypothetical protein